METATMTEKKALRLVGTHSEEISELTWLKRFSDPRIKNWLSTTQGWCFPEGDALVVVTGHGSYASGFTVIRVGTEVQVYECSIADALDIVGLKASNYIVTGPKGNS